MKWVIVLVLFFVVFVSGCEGVKESPERILLEQDESIEFRKLGEGDVGYTSYNFPTGEYVDREGKTYFHIANEEEKILELDGGYIVEFKDPPVVKKELELKKLEQANIDQKIEEYREELSIKHNEFISLSEQTLGKDKENFLRREFTEVLNGFSLDISYYEVDRIRNLPGVKRVSKNELVGALLMDSVPLINANDAWDLGYTGEGIKIAIIDTGIDYNHPDLGGCFGDGCKVVGGYDIYNQDEDPMDDHGHGTHVAGISTSEDGNQVGLKGIAPNASLYAYKVLDSGGSGYMDGVIEGIERAVLDEVDVISMSLGGSGNPDDAVSTATDNAVDSGVVVVIAAGNSGSSYNTIKSPATARKVITVGATYKKNYDGSYWGELDPLEDQVTGFSSRGPVIGNTYGLVKPDVVAPGAIICASRYDSIFPEGENEYYYPCVDEDHVQLAGTSMSAPIVSGVVALLLEKNQNWTPYEIKMALRNTGINLNYDLNTQGYGRVDALEAIQLNTPPVAYINTSGKIGGLNISITGIASGENFINYSLSYANSHLFEMEEGDWVEVCSGLNPISEGELCLWEVVGLSDGEYTLRLEVNGDGGQSIDYVYVDKKNVEITEPFDLNNADTWNGAFPEILPTWESIQINGSAIVDNFSYYEINWTEKDGDVFISEGITLTNEGWEPVINGELAWFNLSVIDEAGFYEILLSVYDINGNLNIHVITIYVDPTLHEGWPRKTWSSSGNFALAFLDQPTIEDIDNDGKKDVITAYGKIIAVVDDTGEFLPGWPVEIEEGIFQSGPAVEDIDNDGYNEIVIGNNIGYLHVLNHDGTYVFEPQDIGTYLVTPTIADINNDNELEIIVGDWWGYLKVLDASGEYLSGWPKYLETHENYTFFRSIRTSATIGNLDEDKNNEIVVSSSACDEIAVGCHLIDMNSRIWILNDDGSNVAGWPKDLFDEENIYKSNIVLADIDQDNEVEILSVSPISKKIYAWNLDGSDVEEWPVYINTSYETPMHFKQALSVGDINGDGDLEIFISDMECLYVYDSFGNFLEDFSVCGGEGAYSSLWGQSSIIDLDEDNDLEIVLQSYDFDYYNYRLSEFFIIDYGSLENESSRKFVDEMSFGNVAPASDIDGDGMNEFMAGTWAGTTYIWDTKGDSNNYEWSVFQYDSRHTGNYNFGELVESTSNRLKNPSFETDKGYDYYPDWDLDDKIPNNLIPDGWKYWDGGQAEGVIDSQESFLGNNSFKINLPEIVESDRNALYQDVPVVYKNKYKVSGYVKTNCLDENCYGTILTTCHDENHNQIYGCGFNTPENQIERIFGNSDWTKIEYTLEGDNIDADYIRVYCYHTPWNSEYPNPGAGTILCDDFKVEEISKPEEELPDIATTRQLLQPKEIQEQLELEKKTKELPKSKQRLSPLQGFWDKLLEILF